MEALKRENNHKEKLKNSTQENYPNDPIIIIIIATIYNSPKINCQKFVSGKRRLGCQGPQQKAESAFNEAKQ